MNLVNDDFVPTVSLYSTVSISRFQICRLTECTFSSEERFLRSSPARFFSVFCQLFRPRSCLTSNGEILASFGLYNSYRCINGVPKAADSRKKRASTGKHAWTIELVERKMLWIVFSPFLCYFFLFLLLLQYYY